MYKRFILKPISENTFSAVAFISKKNKIIKYEYIPLITLEEIKNKEVYLILKPSHFFYEVYHLNLPLFQSEIVKLRLQERLNSLGYFNKPVELYWKVLKKEGNFYKISYLALEQEEIIKYFTKFRTLISAKLEVITFLPLALSAILEDEEDKIIIHREKEGLWITFLSNKVPYNIEFFPIDVALGINWVDLISRINFLLNLFYRETQREIKKLYLSNLEDYEELKKTNLEIYLIEKPYAEYFGVLQVDSAFNFLPEEEKTLIEVLKNNYKIAYGFLALALLFWGFGISLHLLNSNIEKDINRKESIIKESINRLFLHYPEAKVQALRTYLEERENLKRMPKVENSLLHLFYSLQDTYITQLELKNGTQTYEVFIVGEKKAPLSELNTFSQNFAKELSKHLIIKNIDFSYEGNKINFKVSGNLK